MSSDHYHAFADMDGFARVVEIDEVLHHDANLNIPLYMRPNNNNGDREKPLGEVIAEWQQSSDSLRRSADDLFRIIKGAT